MLGTPAPRDAVAGGYDSLVRPGLSTFSAAALDLAEVRPSARILDVATGPGTLPLLAASRVHAVVGVDFSEAMLHLARANTARLPNVTIQHGDGQDLTFEAEFDAAFSIFGLTFFPDRAAGFSSLFRALHAAFPDAPASPPPTDALHTAEQITAELASAGFVDVQVVERVHSFSATADEVWKGIEEGFAPVVHARQTMPEAAWQAARSRGLAWLADHHDAQEELEYVAWLGPGRRP